MIKYIGKRLLSAVPVLVIVSIVIFMIIHLTPGDPARVMLGDQALEQDVEALRELMGLNDPLITQYINWIKGIFRGDFGTSIFIQGSMLEIIKNHIGPTIALTISSLSIAVIMAIPLGILAAKNRGRVMDQLVTGFSMFGVSIPNFLLGLLIMLFFGVFLKVLPIAGYKSPMEGFGEFVRYMILPSLSLGLMHAALITRMTRSAMLEVLNSDYIKMARAKGAKALGIEYVALEELLAKSHIISLNMPLNAQTKGFIDESKIALMRPDAVFINCARGAIVDNEALTKALNEDRLGFACIDVFDMEPALPEAYCLLHAKNTLLTPHQAFISEESMMRRAEIVFNNVYKYLEGTPVNICSL